MPESRLSHDGPSLSFPPLLKAVWSCNKDDDEEFTINKAGVCSPRNPGRLRDVVP